MKRVLNRKEDKYKLSKEDIPGILAIFGLLLFTILLIIVAIYIQNGRL